MIKIFSVVLSALVILLCIAPVTVYADDTDYFTDYDDTKLNPVNNSVVSIKHILQGAQDYHNGNITADEFVNNVLVTAKDGADANLTGLINTAVDSYNFAGSITRDFWNDLVNGINGIITDNGGSVSGFPIGGNIIARYNIPGGSYIEFYPRERGYPQEGVYDLGYNVYFSDGSLALANVLSCYCDPKGHTPCFFINSFKYSYSESDSSFYSVSFDFYDPYPTQKSSSGTVRIPFVTNTGDPDLVTDTPDVGVLSDDDFYKYIDSLIDNLDKLYPDLSTIDGKLQEIINLLNKTQNGCSCDELAAAIRELISRLDNSGSDTELNNTLKELVKKLENNQDLSSVIDKIEELRKDLLKAYAFDYTDKDIKTVISKYNDFSDYLINKKFAFVGSLTSIINTAVDSYKKSGDNSMFTVTFNGSSHTIDLAGAFSSDQLDVLRYMIAAFIYVQFALSVYRRIPGYINNGGDR